MIDKLTRSLQVNGIFFTTKILKEKTWRTIYNYFLSRRFSGRPHLNVHPSATIRGFGRIELGDGFFAGPHLWLEAVTSHGGRSFSPQIIIGARVGVNENVHIAATHSVIIGDDVLMASRIYISDHHHGNYDGEDQSSPDLAPNDRPLTANAKVVIGERVWIGEMVSVLAGVTIGEGCIIGSGSVVTKSIPPYCIAVGSPARIIKRFDFMEKKWILETDL